MEGNMEYAARQEVAERRDNMRCRRCAHKNVSHVSVIHIEDKMWAEPYRDMWRVICVIAGCRGSHKRPIVRGLFAYEEDAEEWLQLHAAWHGLDVSGFMGVGQGRCEAEGCDCPQFVPAPPDEVFGFVLALRDMCNRILERTQRCTDSSSVR